jgi:hypothetical protein
MRPILPPHSLHPRAILCLLALGGLLLAEALLAHGTMHTPASRIYKCRFDDNPENPQDAACAAAVGFAGSPQFLYDWAGVGQGGANGQHQVVVPDGEHCNGGGSAYAALDLLPGPPGKALLPRSVIDGASPGRPRRRERSFTGPSAARMRSYRSPTAGVAAAGRGARHGFTVGGRDLGNLRST